MRRLAWEAWARAGVFLGITLRPDLRDAAALVREFCVGVAYNLGLAARDSAFAMLMRELHDDAARRGLTVTAVLGPRAGSVPQLRTLGAGASSPRRRPSGPSAGAGGRTRQR